MITIDEKNIIGFPGNDINKIISDIITRSLSAIGSSIYPIMLSWLYFLAINPSKKSEIEAKTNKISNNKKNFSSLYLEVKLIINQKPIGIIKEIIILKSVKIFAIITISLI